MERHTVRHTQCLQWYLLTWSRHRVRVGVARLCPAGYASMWASVDLVQRLTGEMLMVISVSWPVPIQAMKQPLVHSFLHNGGEWTSRGRYVSLLDDDVAIMNDQDNVEFFLPGVFFVSVLILIISCRSRSPDFLFMDERIVVTRDSMASPCT